MRYKSKHHNTENWLKSTFKPQIFATKVTDAQYESKMCVKFSQKYNNIWLIYNIYKKQPTQSHWGHQIPWSLVTEAHRCKCRAS